MPRGGPRPGSGPAPKLNPDGTRVYAKRKAPAPGETPRSRGRPPKLNPDGTRANPPRRRAIQPPVVAAAAMPALPAADFSSLPFPEIDVDEMPLDMLLKVMRDRRMHPEVRMRAAQVALPFTAQKPGEVKKGKKEEQQEAAEGLAKGGSKFGAGRAPLRAVGTE